MTAQSTFSRPRYVIDGLVVAMLAAALLDTATTWFALSHRLGNEGNHLAAVLFRHSAFWIPVYLLSRPLLVPLLPKLSRRAFAVFLLTDQLLAGINNLGGILFHRYVIAEFFGIIVVRGLSLSLGAWFFLSALARLSASAQEKWRQVLILIGLLTAFSLTEGFFFALRYLWTSR